MSRGRKSIPVESKLVKTGITVTPQMLADLDMLASVTSSSRSAVIVALLEGPLRDVVNSFKESAFVSRENPENGVYLENVALAFLQRIAVLHHKVDGFVLVSFPPSNDSEVQK